MNNANSYPEYVRFVSCIVSADDPGMFVQNGKGKLMLLDIGNNNIFMN